MNDLRDCCKHALIYGKQEIGDAVAANAWLSQDVHEAEIVQSANESAGFV